MLRLTVLKKVLLAEDLILVQFIRPESVSFAAGQHLPFLIPAPEGMVVRRFSIASAPEDDYLEIIVRIVEGGAASAYFSKVSEGAQVDAEPPSGTFAFRSGAQHAHFIASGSGISPLRSILRHAANASPDLPLSLTCIGDIGMLADEFKSMHDRRMMVYADTLPVAALHRPGSNAHFYLCGSPNFVAGMEKRLLEEGAPKAVIFYESY